MVCDAQTQVKAGRAVALAVCKLAAAQLLRELFLLSWEQVVRQQRLLQLMKVVVARQVRLGMFPQLAGVGV